MLVYIYTVDIHTYTVDIHTYTVDIHIQWLQPCSAHYTLHVVYTVDIHTYTGIYIYSAWIHSGYNHAVHITLTLPVFAACLLSQYSFCGYKLTFALLLAYTYSPSSFAYTYFLWL